MASEICHTNSTSATPRSRWPAPPAASPSGWRRWGDCRSELPQCASVVRPACAAQPGSNILQVAIEAGNCAGTCGSRHRAPAIQTLSQDLGPVNACRSGNYGTTLRCPDIGEVSDPFAVGTGGTSSVRMWYTGAIAGVACARQARASYSPSQPCLRRPSNVQASLPQRCWRRSWPRHCRRLTSLPEWPGP
jgi:hypothetical protein